MKGQFKEVNEKEKPSSSSYEMIFWELHGKEINIGKGTC